MLSLLILLLLIKHFITIRTNDECLISYIEISFIISLYSFIIVNSDIVSPKHPPIAVSIYILLLSILIECDVNLFCIIHLLLFILYIFVILNVILLCLILPFIALFDNLINHHEYVTIDQYSDKPIKIHFEILTSSLDILLLLLLNINLFHSLLS